MTDKDTDHGKTLAIDEADAKAATGDQTPLQSRDVPDDLLPEPAPHVSSGIDPAHVQQTETEGNEPKGTLPGV